MKTETLTLKVTPAEKALIKALAADEDQTVSKYLYNLIFKNAKNESAYKNQED